MSQSALHSCMKIEDGQQVQAKVVKRILDQDAENHEHIKMSVTCDDGKIKELMTHNE